MNTVKLEEYLRQKFDIASFRTGQKEIITDVMAGKDVLGVLPTGTGKSLCYQLPSTLMEGLTIVVSPLISLMQDQVKQLKATGYKKVEAINSFMAFHDKKQTLKNLGEYNLIYISPELLLQPAMKNYLKDLHVNLFVIDEAHCISQWGHEFRPDYLRLGDMISFLNNPPVLALSATATKEVQLDILKSLRRPEMIKHIYPMDRENIVFTIQHVENDMEKQVNTVKLLNSYYVPTLIYFSSKRKAEELAEYWAKAAPERRVAFYHGGMEQADRISIQQQFMNGQLDVICCTSAFGMGINKQNIRLIIHYHFPLQVESFIQEVGRAGRDGKTSVSLLLHAKGDEHLPNALIENELPAQETLRSVFSALKLLSYKSSHLPNDEEMMETLQISETQWRFLRYQLEAHGVIKNKTVQLHDDLVSKSYHDIYSLIEKRHSFKTKKLSEMISWIHEDRCLREQLYKSFQKGYKQPSDGCCTNCGFQLSEWQPGQTEFTDSAESWHIKLKKLLLAGADDAKAE